MSAFPDWKKFAIYQREEQTGCIPTGYELLLRAAGARGIDFSAFQEDFDLDRHGGEPRNNFGSVANEIKKKYPSVAFACESFPKGKGSKKLARIEEMIQKKQPVLVSIASGPGGGWHIMPVVDSDIDNLVLLHHVDKAGKAYPESIKKKELVFRHDNWKGGDDIAYLVKW
jgi:hypothetical protein